MYQGWLQLGGSEIANNPRVVQYAKAVAPPLTPQCDDCPDLWRPLGDEPYESPMIDEAPWYDPEVPESAAFAGFYLLSATGFEDDTREVPITQSIGDGGAAGRRRNATKEMRVTGVLIAGDEMALGFGMEWLKSVLDSGCADAATGCEGDDLCYLAACPEVVEGAVDSDADPVSHPVRLTGWSPAAGRWVGGVFTAPDETVVIGPELDPTCDDVVWSWTITPQEQRIVRVSVLGELDEVVADSGLILLQRRNYIRNPTFRTTVDFWTPGPDVDISLDSGSAAPDRAILEATAALDLGDTWLALDSDAVTAAGEPWSARVRMEMDPEGLVWDNLVPNPAVRSLNGWDDEVVRDTVLFFTDSGSARLDVTEDGGTSLGSIGYGGNSVPPQYQVFLPEGGVDYAISAWVNPSQAANARISVSWWNESGVGVGLEIGDEQSVGADAWTRVDQVFTAPATAVRVVVGVSAEAPGGVNSGDRLNVDALMVSPQALVDYFDGDYPDATWTSLPHASPSRWLPSGDSSTVQLVLEAGGTVEASAPIVLVPGTPTEVVIENVLAAAAGPVELSVVAGDTTIIGTILYAGASVLEKAPTVGTYFSGQTPANDEYTSSWTGVKDRSHSLRTRRMPIELTVPQGNGLQRPVLTLISGDQVTVTSLNAIYRDAIAPEDCLEHYLRTIRNVTCIQGPTPVQEYDLGCDGSMRRVQFILSGGPWAYQRVRRDFAPLPGVAQISASDPCGDFDVDGLLDALRELHARLVSGGSIEEDYSWAGASANFGRWNDYITSMSPWFFTQRTQLTRWVAQQIANPWPLIPDAQRPLIDPDCPLPPPPPRPPLIEDCVADIGTYERRVVAIPGSLMAPHHQAVPVITLQVNSATAVRQTRIRFWPDPLGLQSIIDLDPCSWCGDFLISFMPGRSEFVIDGMIERAISTRNMLRKDATHLLYGTDGGPMTWPLLTCGTPYLMTVDTSPISSDVVTTSLELVIRS